MNQPTLNQTSLFTLVVTSTLSSTSFIELFFNDFSCTKITNTLVVGGTGGTQQYFPMQNNNTAGAAVILKTGTSAGNTYALAYPLGGYDAFTNAAGATPPAGFSSQAYVYWVNNGNQVYQPGYNGGTLDSGNVTIASTETNYRHVFDVSGLIKFNINKIIMSVGATYTNQLTQNFQYEQVTIGGQKSATPLSPANYRSENAQQANIQTFPLGTIINRKTGLLLPIIPAQNGNGANIVTMTTFITCLTPGGLDLF